MRDSLTGLIAGQPGDAPAIAAADRPAQTYGGLRALTERTLQALSDAGIGRGDRVAIVLPNGPAMAAAFVTIAQRAATAPLNPAYRLEEFDFYLGDLEARALVVPAGEDGPPVLAARRRGIALLRLECAAGRPAGDFTLVPETVASGTRPDSGPVGADDVALFLHTSGTTARPKLVPLSHANIVASARSVAASLRLKADDRCLNVMPLFHIHGLVGALASSLAAGGSVWCAPGFDSLRFFGWLDAARPSWYTAVPTMHQAILARAARNPGALSRARLRLIRSSSAALPPAVMRALVETFGVPVIEAYGMTEAAHQIAANPLPPRTQKPGSVGPAAGPQVRIAHEAENQLLPAGATGEVVIAGPGVTRGYAHNPEANARSFFVARGRRWFRTGDQGVFDADGYLRLTGRLKEIINCGGEKVSPLEVDAVLMDHPAVRTVVTFALPHPKLGEEVAAAIVLREGAQADARDVRTFAAARLAGFKVPSRIVFVAEIPMGSTGKLQRIGLAAKLGMIASGSPERC